MSMTMGEGTSATDELKQAQEELATANENLGSSYEEIGNKFSDFYTEIENSGSIFDNFNEQILISDDEKQALADNMDSVQGEITEIARLAADERRELTGSEIQRLDELFQKMHELSEQELALEEAKQGVVTTQAKALNDASGISLEEYTQRSQKLVNSAEETRTAVIDKAYEQYTEEVALLDLRLQTDSEYSEKEHKADVEAAEKRYQDAINAANKEAGDTLAILQQGYYDRADALKESTDELKRLNNSEEDENHLHYMKMQDIQRDYNDKLLLLDKENINQEEYNNKHLQLLYDKKLKEDEENSRNSNKIKEIRNEQQKILDDENYQEQVAGFTSLEALYETYTGKTGEHSDNIVRAFFKPMENMPKDTKEKFQSAVDGAIKGLDERKDTLFYKATEIAGGFINTFKKMFNINSPSRVFKKIFKYVIEGGEVGVDDEAPKLYKQADDVASTFTKRMQAGVSADGLVSKMKAAVSAGRAFVAQKLTANVVHEVELHNNDNNKKYFFKGDVVTHLNIDGREFAVVTAPYMSEELAWEGK